MSVRPLERPGSTAALEAARGFLRTSELCWLATSGPQGLTCSTLYYALPEPWCLLVLSSSRSRHVANLRTERDCTVAVPRIPSRFGEPARQLTARCTAIPTFEAEQVEAEAELFFARYPRARTFVERLESAERGDEVVAVRLLLRDAELLDEDHYGIGGVVPISGFPSPDRD